MDQISSTTNNIIRCLEDFDSGKQRLFIDKEKKQIDIKARGNYWSRFTSFFFKQKNERITRVFHELCSEIMQHKNEFEQYDKQGTQDRQRIIEHFEFLHERAGRKSNKLIREGDEALRILEHLHTARRGVETEEPVGPPAPGTIPGSGVIPPGVVPEEVPAGVIPPPPGAPPPPAPPPPPMKKAPTAIKIKTKEEKIREKRNVESDLLKQLQALEAKKDAQVKTRQENAEKLKQFRNVEKDISEFDNLQNRIEQIKKSTTDLETEIEECNRLLSHKKKFTFKDREISGNELKKLHDGAAKRLAELNNSKQLLQDEIDEKMGRIRDFEARKFVVGKDTFSIRELSTKRAEAQNEEKKAGESINTIKDEINTITKRINICRSELARLTGAKAALIKEEKLPLEHLGGVIKEIEARPPTLNQVLEYIGKKELKIHS